MKWSWMIGIFLSVSVFGEVPKYNLTPEEEEAIIAEHQRLRSQPLPRTARAERPFGDIERAGYLIFSASNGFDSLAVKRSIVSNLPEDVTLVIYTQHNLSREEVLRPYKGYIDFNRVKVIRIGGGGYDFWSRDGVPVPVWGPGGTFQVVDARYYHSFEPDQDFARLWRADLKRHDYYFEGGNFMANTQGDCLTVENKRNVLIPTEVFLTTYGCRRVLRFPHLKGIGHVDESARFLSDRVVLTDSPAYRQTLLDGGFEVVEVPRPGRPYETYVNSLIINGTAFVPVFGRNTDQVALQIYRDHGYKTVPINTYRLSNEGLGSIHCITMDYPPLPFDVLLKQWGAEEI